MLFVIDGELTLIGESGETRQGAGTSATFVRRIPHGLRNDTDRTVRLAVAATPGFRAAAMFRHFDRAGRETGRPLRPEEIVAIAGQYGVSFG